MSAQQSPTPHPSCTGRIRPGYTQKGGKYYRMIELKAKVIKRGGKYYKLKEVKKATACKLPTVTEMRAALKKAGLKEAAKFKGSALVRAYATRNQKKKVLASAGKYAASGSYAN